MAPLFFAQEMTGLRAASRASSCSPPPGTEAQVRAALCAGGRTPERRVHRATTKRCSRRPRPRATSRRRCSRSISALVGFLFAFNAMLLTVPQRRRLIADLRRDGYTPATVIGVLLLDALVLGLLACLLGLALGDELSIHLFRSNPGYLRSAFAVGTQRVVGWQSVAIAPGGGMLAAIVAVLSPLRDILSRDPLAAITPRQGSTAGSARAWRPALVGVLCLAAATAISWPRPTARSSGWCCWSPRCCSCCRCALAVALALLARLAPASTGAVAHVAGMELSAARARAHRRRGDRRDRGVRQRRDPGRTRRPAQGPRNAAHDENAYTDLWVSPPGAYNLLRTTAVRRHRGRQLARLPGRARRARL